MTKRSAFLACTLALAAGGLPGITVHAAGREFPGMTMEGPTGLVLSPTGQVVRGDWFAFGMTRGIAKASYGLFGLIEAGFATPDLLENPSKDDWVDELSGFVKVGGAPLPGAWWCPALAVGAERRGLLTSTPTGYGSASWSAAAGGWLVEAVLGAGTGRFLNQPFGGFGVIPPGLFNRSMKFMCEYAGERAEAGAALKG